MGPLSEEERDGLKPDYITDRQTVYQLEQTNIEDALQWLRTSRLKVEQVLSVSFIQRLHQEMFGQVWKWAGLYRKTEKNIGILPHLIAIETQKLVDDAHYWYDQETYGPIELAIRFKHRLVSIHCFPNGNGRHSRLMADLIVEKLYRMPYFNWGSSTLVADDVIRKTYISALKKADNGELGDLIDFANNP